MAGRRAAAGKTGGAERRSGPRTVVLLLGDDHERVEKEIERLRGEALGSEGAGDLDAASVNAAESAISIPETLADARSIPFLSPRRFVAIRHVDRHSWTEDDREALAEYVANPSPTTTVVLTADSLPRNQRPYMTLAAADAVVELPDLRSDESPAGFAARIARGKGYELSAALAETLVARIGVETVRLRNEVEKLAIHLGARDRAALSDLDTMVPDEGVMQGVWDLTNSLSRRDLGNSLALLRRALSAHQVPHMIVGQLAKTAREALAARAAMDRGGGYREVQTLLGNPFLAQKAMDTARSFPAGDLRSLVRALHRADLRMKSGAPPAAALEEALYGLPAAVPVR